MTGAEWLVCTDPGLMLEALRGMASERKLRLTACAFCRMDTVQMSLLWAEHTIGAAERCADGMATAEEVAKAVADLTEVGDCLLGDGAAAWKAHGLLWVDAYYAALYSIPGPLGHAAGVGERGARADCCDRLRCLFGNPLPPPARGRSWLTGALARVAGLAAGSPLRAVEPEPPPTLQYPSIDPEWLTSTVVALARSVYAERAFDRLPILADALEDAGCDNADVLSHCRGDGPHVRGCWVIDLLLGKG